MQPADDNEITSLIEARNRVLAAQRADAQRRIDAIGRLATITRDWYSRIGSGLLEQAREVLEVGEPPRVRELCGLKDLEKPMNRVLGWIFDPVGSHGAGALPLIRLAKLVGANTLAEDAEATPAKVEVYREESPRDFPSSKEPDLLVRSPRAALLLENKILAPESGDQYGPYEEAFRRWAGDRECHLVLSAPTLREKHEDYQLLLHSSIAELLSELAGNSELPLWSRITLITLIQDIEGGDTRSAIGRIRLITDTADKNNGPLGPEKAIELRNLIATVRSFRPWEG